MNRSGDIPALADRIRIYVAHSETERVYLRYVRGFIRWFEREYGAAITVANISLQVVERYRQWCLARTTQRAVGQRMTALRWWGHWLVAQAVTDSNPLEGL